MVNAILKELSGSLTLKAIVLFGVERISEKYFKTVDLSYPEATRYPLYLFKEARKSSSLVLVRRSL